MMAGLTIVFCLFAFIVGGIPFGYLAGRYVLRDDIRLHGSGNIGATNVARILGWKWGAVVLVLDAIKGLLPTLGAKLFLQTRLESDPLLLATIATGVCAIIGHMYPIWLRLRGGKGVATALGVVLVISPVATGVAVGSFLMVILITRIAAIASIVASLSFGATQLFMLGASAIQLHKLPLTLFSLIIPAMIIWRHRENIRRIFRGQENRIAGSSTTESHDQSAI